MENVIEVKNINKKFKDHTVLKDVSLEVEKGTICGIIGHNGSGKSVLFKILVGILYPNSGEVFVNGIKIKKGIFPDNIGIILDCTGFMPSYSAFDNLKMIASINNVINNDDIYNILEKVGLESHSKQKVKDFSLGMKQRLALAQAFMEKPEILLLDEPMNGLDYEGVDEVRSILKELNEKENVTILLTSHIKEDIDILCDKVYRINKGVMEYLGLENK